MSKVKFVSLGLNCYAAAVLDRLGLDRAQCPFDWMSTTVPMVQACIDDDFAKLLDRQYYQPVPQPDGKVQFKHSGYKTPWRSNFTHFDPGSGKGRYYLERCVERFRDIMASDERKVYLCITGIFPFERQRFEKEFVPLQAALALRARNAAVVGITMAVDGREPGFMQAVDLGDSKLMHYSAADLLAGIKSRNPADDERIDRFVSALAPAERGHEARPVRIHDEVFGDR